MRWGNKNVSCLINQSTALLEKARLNYWKKQVLALITAIKDCFITIVTIIFMCLEQIFIQQLIVFIH